MSLSQAKIDLAVMYKLYEHAESGGEAIPPADIMRLFDTQVSLRRIELALEELHAKGDVERKYHPFYNDEGLWEISRDGMDKAYRALRVPTSFIARLHANGDSWLTTEEAKKAVLKKLNPESSRPTPSGPSIVSAARPQPKVAIDWTKWGTIAAWLAIPLTIAGILVAIWLDKN